MTSRAAAYLRRALVGLLIGGAFLLVTSLFGHDLEIGSALILLGGFVLLGLGGFTPTPNPPNIKEEDEK